MTFATFFLYKSRKIVYKFRCYDLEFGDKLFEVRVRSGNSKNLMNFRQECQNNLKWLQNQSSKSYSENFLLHFSYLISRKVICFNLGTFRIDVYQEMQILDSQIIIFDNSLKTLDLLLTYLEIRDQKLDLIQKSSINDPNKTSSQ